MDVARLRVLRELADRGTIHATAHALSLTPSAVSQQLKRLQREVGVELLERDGRRLRLTAAGKTLVLRADEVVSALQRADADMESFRSTPQGPVRVAMVRSAAVLLLPQLVTDAGKVGMEVIGSIVDHAAGIENHLLADYDVVVIDRDERTTTGDSLRVDVTPLLREPLEIVLHPDHHLADADHVELQDLAHCPWIGAPAGDMVDDVLRTLAIHTGVETRIVQRINDFRVVEELVAAEVGVALLPRHTATNFSLVRKPVGGVEVARCIEALTRPGATSRPAVKESLDILLGIATAIEQT